MPILRFIAIALGAYLIGSISPALIISRHVEKKDVRQFGSGNAGASNMVRNFGWAAGLATFGLDMLKGAAATLLGKWAGGDLGAAIAAVAVVLGHSFPVYYGFRGGKGVSASMGAMLAVAPIPSLVVYLIAILVVAITGIVSIGSLLGSRSSGRCWCSPSSPLWGTGKISSAFCRARKTRSRRKRKPDRAAETFTGRSQGKSPVIFYAEKRAHGGGMFSSCGAYILPKKKSQTAEQEENLCRRMMYIRIFRSGREAISTSASSAPFGRANRPLSAI